MSISDLAALVTVPTIKLIELEIQHTDGLTNDERARLVATVSASPQP